MTRFKLIASSYLILIKDDQILLQRRQNTGYEDGKYSIPAGHLEENESITECLLREVKEEIGLELNAKDVELVHTMHRRENDIRVDLFFITNHYTGEPFNAEPEKCDDLSWFPLDELPENIVPYIKQAINCYLNKEIYSESGW